MPRSITAVLVAIILTLPSVVAGQDRPGDDIRSRLRAGDRIRIVDATGTLLDGRFDRLSQTQIELTVKKKVVAVPVGDVQRLQVQQDEGDGVLIGMGIGAIVGLAFVRMDCRDASEHRDCLQVGSLLVGIPTTIAGALVDHGFRRFDTILEKPSGRTVRLAPVLAARRRGVTLLISF